MTTTNGVQGLQSHVLHGSTITLGCGCRLAWETQGIFIYICLTSTIILVGSLRVEPRLSVVERLVGGREW